MVKKWIQKAIHRPGRLHFNLGIPKEVKIPIVLLNKIVNAKAGDIITNPKGDSCEEFALNECTPQGGKKD